MWVDKADLKVVTPTEMNDIFRLTFIIKYCCVEVDIDSLIIIDGFSFSVMDYLLFLSLARTVRLIMEDTGPANNNSADA